MVKKVKRNLLRAGYRTPVGDRSRPRRGHCAVARGHRGEGEEGEGKKRGRDRAVAVGEKRVTAGERPRESGKLLHIVIFFPSSKYSKLKIIGT